MANNTFMLTRSQFFFYISPMGIPLISAKVGEGGWAQPCYQYEQNANNHKNTYQSIIHSLTLIMTTHQLLTQRLLQLWVHYIGRVHRAR